MIAENVRTGLEVVEGGSTMSGLRARLTCLLHGHDYSCQESRLCIGGSTHYCRRCGWNKAEYDAAAAGSDR